MLGNSLSAPVVPEISRTYLNQKLGADCNFAYSDIDLLEIATQQVNAEHIVLAKQLPLMVCDTDLLVLIIWSEVRFGQCHSWILNTFEESIATGNRHYLLCDHHIPWQPDPLREHADSRGELFELYRQKLDYFDLPCTIVEGNEQTRLLTAQSVVHNSTLSH